MADPADKKDTVSAGHIPVLRDPVINLLAISADGLFIDGTLGGGGHSAALLARGCAQVLGLDRDATAVAAARLRFAALRATPNVRFTSTPNHHVSSKTIQPRGIRA